MSSFVQEPNTRVRFEKQIKSVRLVTSNRKSSQLVTSKSLACDWLILRASRQELSIHETVVGDVYPSFYRETGALIPANSQVSFIFFCVLSYVLSTAISLTTDS